MVYVKKQKEKRDVTKRVEKIETDRLEDFLSKQKTKGLKKVLKDNEDYFIDVDDKKKFSIYVRDLIAEKGLTQVDVAYKAGFSKSYGNSIMQGDTHPNKKDTILRLGIAAGFTLKETNRALKLNGLQPLYAKYKRDFVLMVAINEGKKSVEEIDEILKENGLEKLDKCIQDT